VEQSLSELAAELRGAGERVKKVAPQIVAKAGFDVAEIADALVPVDTGATRNSIQSLMDPGGMGTTVGPATWYSPFLEFGTARMAPRPFMAPALTAVAPGFQQAALQLGVDAVMRPAGGYETTSPAGKTYTATGPAF